MQTVHLRLQLALRGARMSIWDSSAVGGSVSAGMVYWSADGAALIGLPPVEQTQAFTDYLAMVHPDDRACVVGTMQRQADRCAGYDLDYRLYRPDGTLVWLHSSAEAQCEDGVPVRTIGLIWDDTARKRLEQQLFEQKELAEVTLASIGDAVVTTDVDGNVRFLNRIGEQLTGWTSEQAAGAHIDTVVPLVLEGEDQPLESPVLRCLRLRQAIGVSSHDQLITRDGHRVAIEDGAAPIRARDGTILGAVMVFRDVSHARQLAHQVSWQAAHDPLTGLINRRAFETAVAEALRNAKEDDHRHALLYMDLDRFKIVNDSCGHGAGDMLLQTLSRLLQDHMRESDVLARLGGDELGVLLSYCPLPGALRRADEIRQAVRDFRFLWGDRAFELGISIGLVEIDADSKSMSELMIAADQACYLAKEQGRNRVHVYRESDVMLARRQGELQWVARLHDALAHDRFRLFSQPIVPLDDAAAGHEEVLIRFANGDGGLVLPGAFIPAAERYDLMAPLDRWVVTHVCRHLAARQAGHDGPPPSYAINLSGMSLGDEGMLAHIIAQIEHHAIEPSRLCFEITETAVIANLPRAQEFIGRLRGLGCRFSLDDFGSGLSSFAYLRTLPVDYLKIDGVFIRDIARNAINHALVKAINEVGHVMGIRTVAEFVEDDPTLDAVRALGIDYAQGYALGEARQM
jgi:diguanylate cyclase (GGDEF)-like protein/PAS domain S-box-containing protein